MKPVPAGDLEQRNYTLVTFSEKQTHKNDLRGIRSHGTSEKLIDEAHLIILISVLA